MINRPAGGYLMCTDCKTIVSNDDYTKDSTLSNPKNPFPECGHKSVRELWPRWDVLTIIDDTNLEDSDSQNSGTLKLILYNSIFDFQFEDFLVDLLRKCNTANNVIDFILNSSANFPDRIALFKQLTGEKLKDVLENNGFADFGSEFRILRDSRNNFVHRTFEVDFDDLAHCFEVIERDMLKVFMFLHNKYISTR
ncbi:MAG: hypothetical protein PHG31_06180 [Candidatus Omnitrophica bacterium]|nr:hypothetical protein [Candidatus Omnitrophota bacterium]